MTAPDPLPAPLPLIEAPTPPAAPNPFRSVLVDEWHAVSDGTLTACAALDPNTGLLCQRAQDHPGAHCAPIQWTSA